MNVKRRFFALLFLALSGLTLQTACQPGPHMENVHEGAPSPVAAGDHIRTLQVNGFEVVYILHIPKRITVPASVILAFHPALGTPESMADVTQLSGVAEDPGFIVVYPRGYWGTWNAGECCGMAARQRIDQVAWVRAILSDVAALLKLGTPFVFATGFSNGALFAYYLACHLSETIAAIAVVSSGMGASECRPVRAVPMIYFHGTADKLAPYRGGGGILPGVPAAQLGAMETMNRWAHLDGCTREERVDYAKGSAICLTRPICDKDAEVTLCTIVGLGHQWPGGRVLLPELLGPGTKDLSATEMIVNFFRRKIKA